MPRGGFRIGAGRPRKDAVPRPALEVAQAAVAVGPVPPQTELDPTEIPAGRRDAMRFLTAVMRSKADIRLRIDAAKTLLPYQHGKIAETGKKDQQHTAAKVAASKFVAAQLPKLAAAGGRKV